VGRRISLHALENSALELRGHIEPLVNGLLFLSVPVPAGMRALRELGLSTTDFPAHSLISDLLVAIHNQALLSRQASKLFADVEVLRRVCDSVDQGIVVCHDDGRIRWISASLRRILLLPSCDWEGVSLKLLDNHLRTVLSEDPIAVPRLDLLHESSLQCLTDDRLHSEFSNVFQFPVIDGRTIALSVVSIDSASVFLFRDVSALIESRLGQKLFLSTALHEIRRPVSNIIGYADLLMNEGRGGGAALDKEVAIQKIQSQALLLAELSDQLLDLASLEHGFNSLDRESLPLRDILNAVLSQIDDWIDRRNVRLDAVHGGIRVAVSLRLAVQAVINLVSNAIKFSDESSTVLIRTRLELRRGKYYVGVSVLDHGIGMTKVQVEKAFEPFYRGDRLDHFSGFGLGLHFVKETVEAQGGFVELQSEPGKGTEATIWLLSDTKFQY